ncbi:MAG: hypothetical protein J5918_06760 [Prevotella sp.]|jgi:hypothetical protein|nr:hypothetical protein [Prevotella sp.]MBR1621472.1 hypothetical protein [Prevotella sp.]
MKKVLFIAIAAAAMTLTSCNQKSEPAQNENAATDSVEVAVDDVANATNELAAALDNKDAGAFQKAYEAIMEKAKTMDPAIVKDYLAKVQEFVKNNMDKVKAVVGTNAALASSVDAFANMPAEGLDKVTETVGKVQEQLKGAKEGVENAAKDAVNETTNKANEAVNKAAEKVTEKTSEAIDNAAKKGADAVKGKLGL